MKPKLKTGLDIWVAALVLLGAVSVTTPVYSEKGELELVKENFPPGERYHTLKMRDPFVPLTRNKGATKNLFSSRTKPIDVPGTKPVDAPRTNPLGEGKKQDRLIDMPLIPMKVYEKIQETDLKTLADLKHYAELFNNVAKLRKINAKEYNKVVSQYRELLLHTQNIGETMAKTELQVNYGKLNFVGMIRKKDQRVALIQTQGH